MIWRRAATALSGLLLLTLTVVAFLAAVDYAAGTRLLPLGTVPWYTAAETKANRARDDANTAFAATNPFSFNGPVSGARRGPGVRRRFIVLGDSFVWGSGLALGDAWPHQLARLTGKTHPDTEIMTWGISGWSTKDELAFLKSTTAESGLLEADGVLVGFVTNDPDVDAIPQKYLSFDGPVWRGLAWAFPDASAYITAHVSAFHARWIDPSYGYGNWEKALYAPENLAAYEKVLRELKTFCDDRHLRLVVVLTPHLPDEVTFHEKYAAVTAILDRAGIAYVNPLTHVVDALGKTPGAPLYQSLWANPANAHPGPALNEIYAADAYRFMMDTGWFSDPVRPSVAIPDQPCAQDLEVKMEPALPYGYLGASYVRLRGTVSGGKVLGGTPASLGGAVRAKDAAYPVYLKSPGGAATAPFWVDMPASTNLGAATVRVTGAGGCSESPPLNLWQDEAARLHPDENLQQAAVSLR